MNLSLYSINAFVILDSEGHRVLAKYYRPKNHPDGEPKGLLTLKEQRAFEKGLWQKTKKPGGSSIRSSSYSLFIEWVERSRRYHSLRFASGRLQKFS
jgi:hypothetical protein